MGCDIHALIERRAPWFGEQHRWFNSGDPAIGRNYEMFAVLAGVRNYDGIAPVSEPRGLPSFKEWHDYASGERWISWHDLEQKPCDEMVAAAERYGADGHSHSWLTLAEIKAYDTTQEVDDESLIVGRDEGGAVTATARYSSVGGETVGRRRVLTWPGESEPKSWLRLIRYMEQAKWDGQSDEEVRLVFFFDN